MNDLDLSETMIISLNRRAYAGATLLALSIVSLERSQLNSAGESRLQHAISR